MAASVRERFAADLGLASTGVAGPAGTDVGLVWTAVATPVATVARESRLQPLLEAVRAYPAP